jgi:hypothetical protein
VEGCQKEPFTAEHGRLDISRLLNVELNALLHSHDASGIHVKDFAGSQRSIHYRAAGMGKDHTVAFEFLHDESFTAEQSGKDFTLEVNSDGDVFGGTPGEEDRIDDQPKGGTAEAGGWE